MPKIKTTFALAVSGRAVGAAWADKLGLIGFDLVTLGDYKTPESAAIVFRSWLDKLGSLINPDKIILEEIDSRRQSAKTDALHAIISHMIRKPTLSFKRKVALQTAAKNEGLDTRLRSLKLTRLLAEKFARQCPELRFHPSPRCRLRADWDRLWGQAVVAGALVLYSNP